MLLLLTWKNIIQRTATVLVFSGAISHTLICKNFNGVVVPDEWQENFHLSVQIVPDQPERISVSACGGNNDAGACGFFTQRWPAHFINYLSDNRRLRKTTNAFGLSWQVVNLSSSSWSQINVTSKHGVQSPKWRSLSLVGYATIPGSYWLQTERGNILCMNRCCVTLSGHVISCSLAR